MPLNPSGETGPAPEVVVVVVVGAVVVVVVVPDAVVVVVVVGPEVVVVVGGGGGGPNELTEPARVTNPHVLERIELAGYLADIRVVVPAVASIPFGDSCHVV